jgi:hypothetical protein
LLRRSATFGAIAIDVEEMKRESQAMGEDMVSMHAARSAAELKRRSVIFMAIFLSAAVGLSVMPTVPMANASASESHADVNTPVAFSVDVQNGWSSSAATEVLVQVWPSTEYDAKLVEGDDFELYKVDAEVTHSTNQVDVRVDAAKIPQGYMTASGMVDFQIQVIDEAAGRVESTSMTSRYVKTSTGEAWIDANYTADDLAALGPAGVATPAVTFEESGEPSDECELEDDCGTGDPGDECKTGSSGGCLVESTLDIVESTLDIGNASAAVDTCVWYPSATLQKSRHVWVRTAALYPLKTATGQGSRMHYGRTSDHHTTAGVGVQAGGASWSQEGTKTLTGGWGQTFSWTKKYRSVRIQMNYGYYKVRRINQFTGSFCADGYQWRPRSETGGTWLPEIKRPKVYTVCSNIANGVWYRQRGDGQAYTNSSGAMIKSSIGINLSSKSQYASHKRLEYDATSGDKKMCGKTRTPAHAGTPMMRYR